MASSAIRSRQLQEIESPQVRAAGRILLQTIATDREKLQAIDFLSTVPSAESLFLLRESFEEEVYFTTNPSDIARRERPRAGPVAGAAARALVRLGTPAADEYLRTKLLNHSEASLLRETIAYGLGGSISVASLRLLGDALADRDDQEVLRQVIHSVRESMDACPQFGRPEPRFVVSRLAEIVRGESWTSDLVRLGLKPTVQHVLSTYCSDEAASTLLATVVDADSLDTSLFALDVLGKVAHAPIVEALANILDRGTTDPEILKGLGVILSRQRTEVVLDTARAIVSERVTVRTLLSNLLPAARERCLRRREAAERILRG